MRKQRWARLFFFTGTLFTVSLNSSFGAIVHGYHSLLFVCFLFIFLPSQPPLNIRNRYQSMGIFTAALGCLLLPYTLSGIWKVISSTQALIHGTGGYFRSGGLSDLVAHTTFIKSRTPFLADTLIRHTFVSDVLILFGIYFQTFSLFIPLRPSLHRIWGFGIILFHLGIQLSMGITFDKNAILAAILMLNSPLSPKTLQLTEIISELPLIKGARELCNLLTHANLWVKTPGLRRR